jgi:ferredoxin, 2Fe-2S
MPFITYIESDGTEHRIEAQLGRTLMQIAVDNGISGILGDCGGSCSCGTCHVYIGQLWVEKLPSISETEAFMLDVVPERRDASRLCCQIPLHADLDGIVVQVPEQVL